jgi:hypothetical protein
MYFHFISLWRSLLDRMSPHDERTPPDTSPSLHLHWRRADASFIILEKDDHPVEVEAVGLLTDNFPTPAVFLGP